LIFACLIYLACSDITYSCTKDWFMANSPVTCPTPRIRRAFGDLAYADQKLYVSIVYQMKLHKGAYLQGSNSNYPLYDIFEQIHASTWNGMLHGTSAFIPQHKFLLWLYESALIYIALVDGPTMNPPVSQQQACALTQPYWEWDQGYSTSTNSWSNILNTDVFANPEFFGDTTPATNTYYVDTGYFSEYTGWKTDQNLCNPSGKDCDKILKRTINPSLLMTSLPSIISYITSYSTFQSFCPYIHGGTHGQIHNFIGCAMGNTGTAAMDPLFYMHHTNIDRLWHIWVDCYGYESVPASSLSNNCPQYFPINPIGGGTPKKDRYNNLLLLRTILF